MAATISYGPRRTPSARVIQGSGVIIRRLRPAGLKSRTRHAVLRSIDYRLWTIDYRLDPQLFRFLRRRDPILHKRAPFVAVRALPEQLCAAVAAAHADVRIHVEHRVAG